MGEFFRGLGKKLQDLLDKIRGKKEDYESVSSIFGTIDTETQVFNKIDEKGFVEIPSCADVKFELVYDKENDINELEKYFSIYRTLLPKRYRVQTLLVTLAANQPYDYQAVDMSQYEEKSLAHFIVGSTKSKQELEAEYDAKWNEEEDGPLWSETGWASAVVGEATLVHYEEFGVWDIEYDE